MAIQHIVGTIGLTVPVSTRYANPLVALWSDGNVLASSTAVEMPTGGTFRNWKVKLSTAPGVGTSRTLTIYKNGSATALSITISGTNTDGSDLSNEVAFAAGDTIAVAMSRSGAVATTGGWSTLEFESDSGSTSVYGGDYVGLSSTGTRYVTPFWGIDDTTASAAAESAIAALIPAAGTVSAYRIKLTAAPGAGKSFVFTLMKNGTAQDGTAGTPDTRITIANAATTGNWAGTLTIAQGDTLSIRAVPSGSPGGPYIGSAIAVDAEPFIGTTNVINTNTSGTTYTWIGAIQSYDATESNREVYHLHAAPLLLTGMYVSLTAAPGVGNSWTFTLRKNGGATAQTVTISGTDTFAICGAAAVSIADGDRYSIERVASTTLAQANPKVSFGATAVSGGSGGVGRLKRFFHVPFMGHGRGARAGVLWG